MKLLRVHIISAKTCGGLLDDLDVRLRPDSAEYTTFEPLCLVGPNGAGKSQFLQAIAEMFQSLMHACTSGEERQESHPELCFELEYLIRPSRTRKPIHVRVVRRPTDRGRPKLTVERKKGLEWESCDLSDSATRKLLPTKIIGYTSGENETLSLPFLVSRSAYADEVGRQALKSATRGQPIADTRLMLIDYGTHLEVLVANLLLGSDQEREALLREARLDDIHSFRCSIQLAHSAAPKAPGQRRSASARKGIQLTKELDRYIDQLQRCATCFDYEARTETYTFDFWVNAQSRRAFAAYWRSALDLYSSIHKLAMLNDLVIPKQTRERHKRDTNTRRFASRLPEPQDEEKVFRFERVQFKPVASTTPVDYVSLSDGEHQLAQLLGTCCMISFPGVLFILDEPESHFNPQWRVECISRILDLPTRNGVRSGEGKDQGVAQQECLLSTHAPFVPSDLPRERVFIFSKEGNKLTVKHPDVETFGTTFDTILEECFGVRPPISKVSREEIEQAMKSRDPAKVKAAMGRLGPSVEKSFLADRLRQLSAKGKT